MALKQVRTGEGHASGETATTEISKRVVLIIDDDAGLLRLLTTILRTADYDVATALNGIDALDIAEHRHFDAIVLDLRMPVLDGPGFYRELRARGDTTPVLVTSSAGARAAQRELGAEGAIEKPFEPEDFVEAVGSLLH